MARIKLVLPEHFPFTTTIPVRISDINYGNHLGNDAVLSILHEARLQYLLKNGLSELSFAGSSLIMGDVAIEFKSEGFYGEQIIASVAAGDFTRVSFDLYYKLTKKVGDKEIILAIAKTGMICYDYTAKKVVAVPEEARVKLMG
jgi:acyl-CoA thioester hydrolase